MRTRISHLLVEQRPHRRNAAQPACAKATIALYGRHAYHIGSLVPARSAVFFCQNSHTTSEVLTMLFDETLRELLAKARTIAIIGAKDKPGQAVDNVGRYLIAAGYTVIPVHPVRREVWGLVTYPSVTDIPVPVDIVNLFRAPQYCPDHAREVLSMPQLPAAFWMQLGIRSTEAGAMMAEKHVAVIEDRCIMVEHQRVMR